MRDENEYGRKKERDEFLCKKWNVKNADEARRKEYEYEYNKKCEHGVPPGVECRSCTDGFGGSDF